MPQHLFLHGLAQAHVDRADHLAVNRHGIERLAAVMRRNHAMNRHFARLRINGCEVVVGGNQLDALRTHTQHLRGDLHLHRVRTLADFRSPRKTRDTRVAINLHVYGRVRHIGANDGIGGAAYVVAARDADAAAMGQLALFLEPTGALDNSLNAFGKAVARHAQTVYGDARSLQQVSPPDLGRVEGGSGREHVQHGLEGETHVDRAVAAHGAAGGLVRQHAVAVKLQIANVVDRAEKRSGIQNGDGTIAAVRAAVLYDPRSHRRNLAFSGQSDFEIDKRDGPAAVGIENFFAGVRDLHRSLRLLG